MGVFYGLKTDGIFQNQAEIDAAPTQNLGSPTSPGDIRFKDINDDGVVDFKDRTYIGKPIADYTLGFNINLKYKGFDFISYAYASVGNNLIRNYERTDSPSSSWLPISASSDPVPGSLAGRSSPSRTRMPTSTRAFASSSQRHTVTRCTA